MRGCMSHDDPQIAALSFGRMRLPGKLVAVNWRMEQHGTKTVKWPRLNCQWLPEAIWAMKPWLFRLYKGDYTTQLCGDRFMNHYKDPYQTTRMTHGKYPAVFIFSATHLKWATITWVSLSTPFQCAYPLHQHLLLLRSLYCRIVWRTLLQRRRQHQLGGMLGCGFHVSNVPAWKT